MERIPPFNLEAERAVLGSCLLDSEALNTAVEMLAAEDFYDPRHRQAFEVIKSMSERSVAVDALTFRDEVNKQNLVKTLGGLSFITSLTEAVTTTARQSRTPLADNRRRRHIEDRLQRGNRGRRGA